MMSGMGVCSRNEVLQASYKCYKYRTTIHKDPQRIPYEYPGDKLDNRRVLAGGEDPILVGGRVSSPEGLEQKHPHPVGQIGTSSFVQQEMWVTWWHRRQLRDKPT